MVETRRETRFDGTSCLDLQKRDRRVQVTGFERASGMVKATAIDRVGPDDDDNDDDDDDD
jgi:hypothetical protein